MLSSSITPPPQKKKWENFGFSVPPRCRTEDETLVRLSVAAQTGGMRFCACRLIGLMMFSRKSCFDMFMMYQLYLVCLIELLSICFVWFYSHCDVIFFISRCLIAELEVHVMGILVSCTFHMWRTYLIHISLSDFQDIGSVYWSNKRSNQNFSNHIFMSKFLTEPTDLHILDTQPCGSILLQGLKGRHYEVPSRGDLKSSGVWGVFFL